MSRYRPLPLKFYRRPAAAVAPELLGRYLVRRLDGDPLVARIVETEAYLGTPDRASHAWQGRRNQRNGALFRQGGVAYVYLIYGLHHCLNAVTGSRSNGEAVLIRAAEPIAGHEQMARNRGLTRAPRSGDIAGGPGKLCQALAIDRDLDGQSLKDGSLVITRGEGVAAAEVAVGPRVGIDYAGDAAEWPLRFAEAGNRHVSRPFPWVGSVALRLDSA